MLTVILVIEGGNFLIGIIISKEEFINKLLSNASSLTLYCNLIIAVYVFVVNVYCWVSLLQCTCNRLFSSDAIATAIWPWTFINKCIVCCDIFLFFIK